MISIRRILLLGFLLLSSIGFVYAQQFPMPTQRPQEDLTGAQVREIVSKYCRLDYEGTRLDPQMWSKFQPLVWWTSAPEISKINVIARYTVDPEPVENHGHFSVSVHYRLLGTFDPTLGYIREAAGTTQDVYFSVTQQNTEWRISESDNNLPHPSRAAMIKWLTAQIATTQDQTLKGRYQGALDQVQEQSASPFAK